MAYGLTLSLSELAGKAPVQIAAPGLEIFSVTVVASPRGSNVAMNELGQPGFLLPDAGLSITFCPPATNGLQVTVAGGQTGTLALGINMTRQGSPSLSQSLVASCRALVNGVAATRTLLLVLNPATNSMVGRFTKFRIPAGTQGNWSLVLGDAPGLFTTGTPVTAISDSPNFRSPPKWRDTRLAGIPSLVFRTYNVAGLTPGNVGTIANLRRGAAATANGVEFPLEVFVRPGAYIGQVSEADATQLEAEFDWDEQSVEVA